MGTLMACQAGNFGMDTVTSSAENETAKKRKLQFDLGNVCSCNALARHLIVKKERFQQRIVLKNLLADRSGRSRLRTHRRQ